MVSERTQLLLKSRNTAERIAAYQKAIKHGGEESRPFVLEGLKDKNNYIAALSAERLGEIADLPAVKFMIERFHYCCEDGIKRDPGCHIRAHLAFAFGRLESIHADDALRVGIRTVQKEPVGGVLFDTGAHLRANCALSLAQIGAQGAVRDLTLLLFDDGVGQYGRGDIRMNFVETRKAAARALGILSTPEARVPLTLRLVYPDGECTEVIQQCMQSLTDLEDPDLESVLARFTNDDQTVPDLAVFATLMLARVNTALAEQVLKELIARYSGNAMRASILALSSIRTETAVQYLKYLASSTDVKNSVREAAREFSAAYN